MEIKPFKEEIPARRGLPLLSKRGRGRQSPHCGWKKEEQIRDALRIVLKGRGLGGNELHRADKAVHVQVKLRGIRREYMLAAVS